MKKLLILTFFVIGLVGQSIGQINTYGVSVGVGGGSVLKKAQEGGASYDLNTGLSIGFQYNRRLTNNLYLQTGVNWYNNSVSVTPNFNPDIDITTQDHNIQLIYVPVLLKIDLSKYFFINGGLIGDIDITKNKYITNQTGIGAGLGIGTEFSINDKFAIQLNPYLNFHGLLLASQSNHPKRMMDTGIKLNLIIK